jgi:hypothetical protein
MRHRLWKSVDNFSGLYRPEPGLDSFPPTLREAPGDGGSAQTLEACSACAGDYEDPDRTAGGEEENDASEVHDEFPAEEE